MDADGVTAWYGWRVALREAFLDRVIGRIDPPTSVKLDWRWKLRTGRSDVRVVSELVRSGDTAIDIGANWGFYTIGLSTLVGPGGHVIAVEPGPAIVRLRATCRRSANVKIYPLALSDREGKGYMEIPQGPGPPDDTLTRIVERTSDDDTAMEVQLTRLDELEIPGRSRLRFIKCDVEGHEDAVLRGGERLIREFTPALLIEIEERHRDRPVSDAFELLSSWGYVGSALTPSGLRPLDQFDVARDQRAHLSAGGELPITAIDYINDFLFVQPDVRLPSGIV